MIEYSKLFADALADVEAGNRHPCKTTEHCCEMGGCPRCFQGVMRGDVGIEHVDVFDSVLDRLRRSADDSFCMAKTQIFCAKPPLPHGLFNRRAGLTLLFSGTSGPCCMTVA